MINRREMFVFFAAVVVGASASPTGFAAGRTACITGGAAGLGKAAALKCAKLGMKICIADIDAEAMKTAEEEIANAGAAQVLSMVCDVSNLEEVEKLKEAVYAPDFGGDVGFLFNNAGTGVGSASAFSGLDGWQKNLNVNLFGALHVVQTFTPAILEQETPCTIVNTGSKQGITCPPGNLAYNVGKAGLRTLTEGLQHELRSSERNAGKVTAHLFVPGWVNSQLAYNYFREIKGSDFDPETDVPWSEDKPAAGAWMPDETIDFMFSAIEEGKFYIICPDNDVTEAMDKKRIMWAAGDIVERDVPLSRWHPDYKEAFAAYMAAN